MLEPVYQVQAPVVLIIFRRPDTTRQVLDRLRQVRPKQLFVVADAPRPDRPDEAAKCAATRALIDTIDWDCQVSKNYAETNMGCAKRVASGLDWAFSQVEAAIILEDDCLPHLSFFQFCDELLERYRDDERVTSISGQNVQFGQRRTDYSYYFSGFNHIWGWATWRRAWQHFDIEMKLWNTVKTQNLLPEILVDPVAVRYWSNLLDTFYHSPALRQQNWDYQWTLSCWCRSGLCAIANVNLVANVGFDGTGTNITSSGDGFAKRYGNLPTPALEFPLRHPPFVVRHFSADRYTQRTLFKESRWQVLKREIKRRYKSLIPPMNS